MSGVKYRVNWFAKRKGKIFVDGVVPIVTSRPLSRKVFALGELYKVNGCDFGQFSRVKCCKWFIVLVAAVVKVSIIDMLLLALLGQICRNSS